MANKEFKTRYTPAPDQYVKGKSGGLENRTIELGRNNVCLCNFMPRKKITTLDRIRSVFNRSRIAVKKREIERQGKMRKHKDCCLNKTLFVVR